MYSVSTFLGTLPRYLLGQDNKPSSTSHRQKLQYKTPSRVQYATGIDSSTSHPVIYSEIPQKLPVEGTSMSTVQGGKASQARQPNLLRQAIEAASRVRHLAFLDTPPEKTSGVRYPTFPSKRAQASPTSYPVFLDTSSYLQRYRQKKISGTETIKISATSGPAYVMGTRIKYESYPD